MSVPASSQTGPDTVTQLATSICPRRRAHQRNGTCSRARSAHPSPTAIGIAINSAAHCHNGMPANWCATRILGSLPSTCRAWTCSYNSGILASVSAEISQILPALGSALYRSHTPRWPPTIMSPRETNGSLFDSPSPTGFERRRVSGCATTFLIAHMR